MIKTVLSLCLVVVLAASGFAQMMDMPGDRDRGLDWRGQMMGRGDMDGMGDMMGTCLANADKIGLTDQQIDKITPIHREMKKKQARFRADLKVAQLELMEIMDVKDFELDRAVAAVRKIEEIRIVHRLEMLRSMKEVRSVLTDEQFRKMKKVMRMMPGRGEGKEIMKKQ